MTTTSEAKKPLISTGLRRVGMLLLSLYLIYLLLANLFLATSLGPWALSHRPQKMRIEWSRAWSWFPGTVHARDVRIRTQTRNTQWWLGVENGRLDIFLPALAAKRFEASDVVARGVSFRLRRRVDPGTDEAKAGDSAPGMAPIPGLKNPPLDPPEPPDPDRRWRWTFEFEDTTVESVREIWIDQGRLTGQMEVAGDFRYRVRGELVMPGVVLHLRQGLLELGGEEAARGLKLDLDLAIHETVPQDLSGVELLAFLRADATVQGTIASLGVLNVLFRDLPDLELGGPAEVEGRIAVDGGQLLPGSRFTAQSEGIEARFLDYLAQGAGTLDSRVEEEGSAPSLSLRVRLSEFQVRRQDLDAPHVEGENFTLEGRSEDLDLRSPFEDFRAEVDLPPSRVPDITIYNKDLPTGMELAFKRGSGVLSAHLSLEAAQRRGRGRLQLESKGLEATFKSLSMKGDLRVTTILEDGDLEKRRFAFGGSEVDLRHVVVDGSRRKGDGWWAELRFPKGTIELSPSPSVDARLEGRLRDTGPLLALLAEKKPAFGWVDSFFRVEDVDLETGLRFGRGGFDLEELQADGKGLEAKLDVDLHDGVQRGVVFLRLHGLSAAVALEEDGRDWKFFHSLDWYQKQLAERQRVHR